VSDDALVVQAGLAVVSLVAVAMLAMTAPSKDNPVLDVPTAVGLLRTNVVKISMLSLGRSTTTSAMLSYQYMDSIAD
jgi:hypothetical protein